MFEELAVVGLAARAAIGWPINARRPAAPPSPSNTTAATATNPQRFHVEARAGGTCVVRVVQSLFASTDDWDGQLTGTD